MNLKTLFYLGVAGFILFEIANVYFIMPMPGSQRMESLDLAYFLYQWRWAFRAVFGAIILACLFPAFQVSRWPTIVALAILAVAVYMFNFDMAAEKMFYQPKTLLMTDSTSSKVSLDKLIIGIERNGQAKAYPIQYIGYHHQVRDTVGGEQVMVTYCTVCRTGRVYAPKVNGRYETFRLVGMDHFNAMFEDVTTGSWWRQVTGEAVAGPLKGAQLAELAATQTSLQEWLKLYPHSLVMQADSTFSEDYDNLDTYDFGIARGKLTRTDTLSWNEKSWVVGLEVNKIAKAFDWNRLKQERIINDKVGEQPVVLALAADDKSFFAFERPDAATVFSLKNDTLYNGEKTWNLRGKAIDPVNADLKKITAYQEFWHSWMTFHPHTTRY